MKILLIEDDQSIANNLHKGLGLSGHVIDLAIDGELGLNLALDNYYDVIILDRMLPKIDGLSLCLQLRQAKINTPILMLTAKTLINDKVEGLNAGADDYLTKPFAFAELLARIKALARRPKRISNQVLRLVDLQVNCQNKQVQRAGKSINLSKKEFSLLAFLLKNPNRYFTAEQLINKVWSYNDDILPNTIQVYISSLRKKIDVAFNKSLPLIKTKRGFGYGLIEPKNVE